MQSEGAYPQQPRGPYPEQPGNAYPQQSGGAYPQQSGGAYPQQPGGAYPQQSGGAYPQQEKKYELPGFGLTGQPVSAVFTATQCSSEKALLLSLYLVLNTAYKARCLRLVDQTKTIPTPILHPKK